MQLMGRSSLTDRSDLVDWAEFPFICPENPLYAKFWCKIILHMQRLTYFYVEFCLFVSHCISFLMVHILKDWSWENIQHRGNMKIR